ncbi:TetR/AcrR family transcriptional regulator [Gordonia shandongensis]|uniref:TetR/AcrR family transcriptional regulator n=1 Tax=Gordonia shandongensis TaxID=376351 RepID=UPI0004169769|nr:TetR/AcrR family transcriptional regulator [Gordonia shandongensis]
MTVDATDQRILDAALDVMMEFGIRRGAVEEVARRAGVSHMTVYRRWSTKRDLLTAVFMQIADEVFAEVDAEVSTMTSIEDQFISGFVAIYWRLGRHRLVSRLLETDPETTLPALTTGAGPIIELATDYLAAHLRNGAQRAGAAIDDPRETAEILVRLCHSLVLTDRAHDRLDTREAAERYARQRLLPLVPEIAAHGHHPAP